MRIALLFLLLAGFVWPSSATIIDDFSSPQGPLAAGVSGVASGPGLVGGFREVGENGQFEASGGVGVLSSADGTGNVMNLAYDGTVTFGDGGVFGPVDLTDGGIATSFLASVTGYEAPSASSLAFAVSDDNSGAVFLGNIGINGPGLYSMPIPTALADFTQIDQVFLALLLGTSPPTGGFVSFDFICTGTLEAGCTTAEDVSAVPEPGTAGLLALGAGMLVLLRRKKASRSH